MSRITKCSPKRSVRFKNVSLILMLGMAATLAGWVCTAQASNEDAVRRGWLGISVKENSPELQKRFNLKTRTGVVVLQTAKGSPAEAAGLIKGDVITEVSSVAIATGGQLSSQIAYVAPGENIRLKFYRGDRLYEKRIQLVERTDTRVSQLDVATDESGREENDPSMFTFTEREDVSGSISLLGVEASGPVETSSSRNPLPSGLHNPDLIPVNTLAGTWVGKKTGIAITFHPQGDIYVATYAYVASPQVGTLTRTYTFKDLKFRGPDNNYSRYARRYYRASYIQRCQPGFEKKFTECKTPRKYEGFLSITWDHERKCHHILGISGLGISDDFYKQN